MTILINRKNEKNGIDTFANLFNISLKEASWILIAALYSICCTMLFLLKYVKKILPHCNLWLEKRALLFQVIVDILFGYYTKLNKKWFLKVYL